MTQNKPKPRKLSIKLTKNDPKGAKTTQNKSKRAKAIQNKPK